MPEHTDLWSDYWSKEGAGGEVFVDAAGQKHPDITAFWAQFAATLEPGQTIVDVGCGAGSVFQSFADAAADHVLIGLDTSPTALTLLAEQVPNAQGMVMTDDAWPLDAAHADVVVSQFGIEYASDVTEAFKKAAELMKPEGQLVCLAHCRGGHIDQIITPQYEGAKAALDTGFARSAMLLVKTKAEGPEGAHVAAREAFKVAERRFVERMRNAQTGVHIHLYGGFRHMFQNWDNYSPEDITQWLIDMEKEMEIAVGRLGAMRDAAMDVEQLETIKAAFSEHGITFKFAEFNTSTADTPVAWSIRASR